MHCSEMERKPKIILAACGAVAAMKFGHICRSFSEWGEVTIVATASALNFIDRRAIPPTIPFYTDDFEWSSWGRIGDTVLHNFLQEWADIMVIAPLTANTLAKMAGGLCDNLLTCILRSWNYSKPVFIAPSMNITAWRNPLTEEQLMSVEKLGRVLYIPSVRGAMAEPGTIFAEVRLYYQREVVDRAGGSGH